MASLSLTRASVYTGLFTCMGVAMLITMGAKKKPLEILGLALILMLAPRVVLQVPDYYQHLWVAPMFGLFIWYGWGNDNDSIRTVTLICVGGYLVLLMRPEFRNLLQSWHMQIAAGASVLAGIGGLLLGLNKLAVLQNRVGKTFRKFISAPAVVTIIVLMAVVTQMKGLRSYPPDMQCWRMVQTWARLHTHPSDLFIVHPVSEGTGFATYSARETFLNHVHMTYPLYAPGLTTELVGRLKLMGVDTLSLANEMKSYRPGSREWLLGMYRKNIFYRRLTEAYPVAVLNKIPRIVSRYPWVKYLMVKRENEKKALELLKKYPVSYRNQIYTVYRIQ
jgi:hypothetical protein